MRDLLDLINALSKPHAIVLKCAACGQANRVAPNGKLARCGKCGLPIVRKSK